MSENIKTHRIKKSIIASLVLNSVSLVILSTLIYFQIEPINEISLKKEEANLLFDDYSKTITSGLNFNDFSAKKWELTNLDSYKKNIISNIDSSFYNKFFVNTWTQSYDNYLSVLWKSSSEKILSKEFKEKQNLLATILPVYSNSALIDWAITDSIFINNLENLIEKYNLSTKDSIAVSDIIPVENTIVEKKNSKSVLDSEIYYFKLPLKLTGTKKDIIDFITYLEKVWSIKITWNDFNIDTDSYGQIADIDSIKIQSYLDSDKSTINKWNFVDFIKLTQWSEKLDIDLVINFYVKWLASYKVQDYVNNLNKNYTKLSKDTLSLISKINQKDRNFIRIFNNLNYIKRYLDTIKKDVSDLVTKSKKSEDISVTYSQAYKITNTLSKLSKELDTQKTNIDSLKNNKK